MKAFSYTIKIFLKLHEKPSPETYPERRLFYCANNAQRSELFLTELGSNEVFQSLDCLSLIRTVSNDRDLRAFDKTHAHDHEDALSINRLAFSLDLNFGFEFRSRLDENGCRTSMNTSFVLDRNNFLSHCYTSPILNVKTLFLPLQEVSTF